MKVIYIGTSQFAAKILEKLSKTNYSPFLIVTNPDRPAGRGKKIKQTPVSLIAQEEKIKTLKPEKIIEIKDIIKKENPTLIIVCAYGGKIPKEILNIPQKGCLNIHPSLLPLYRGPSPISQAIIDGKKETGVTIILMNEKIDQGPILSQEKVLIEKDCNFNQLSIKLVNKGFELILKTIPLWINNKITPIEQESSRATYTNMIKKEDGKIDWNQSAQEIKRKVNGLNPNPGTFSFFKDKKTGEEKMIKIIEADIQEQTKNGPFGPIGKVYVATNNNLAVQSGKDFLIIKKLQIEGKNPVTSEEFMNGNIEFIGTILY